MGLYAEDLVQEDEVMSAAIPQADDRSAGAGGVGRGVASSCDGDSSGVRDLVLGRSALRECIRGGCSISCVGSAMKMCRKDHIPVYGEAIVKNYNYKYRENSEY